MFTLKSPPVTSWENTLTQSSTLLLGKLSQTEYPAELQPPSFQLVGVPQPDMAQYSAPFSLFGSFFAQLS